MMTYEDSNILGIYARCDKCGKGRSIEDLLDTSYDERYVILECRECNLKAFEELDYIGNFDEAFI